jgi:hypothetical protein
VKSTRNGWRNSATCTNPVARGLVRAPEKWRWSSHRRYSTGESGPVLVNEAQQAELRVRQPLERSLCKTVWVRSTHSSKTATSGAASAGRKARVGQLF